MNKNMYTRFLISLFLPLLTLLPVHAQQNEPDTLSQDFPVTPVYIDYASPQRCEIAEIKVVGADNYEDFVLIGYSGLAVGDVVDIPGEKITGAVQRFMRQGLFSDVKIKVRKIEDGKVWLTIELAQRPRVSEVNYIGLKKSEQEDLEIKVGIVQGNQITPNISGRAKIYVKNYLEEKGYHDAQVDVYQRDAEEPGYVIVDIVVDKKQKTKVSEIHITGNEALSYNQINRAMKKTNDNHILNFFRTKKFVSEEYEKDKIALIEKYNEIGYRDACIIADSVVPSKLEEGKVEVYITVDEGEKYYFRDIQWIGNTLYPHEYLSTVLGIKKGDIYNQKQLNERLNEDDDAVSKLYNDRGYLFFNVEPVEVQIVGDSIDLEMRMYEGKPATINEINISGNTRVYENVVRRELYTKPGQLYSQSLIIRSLRELAQMGHFDQENLIPDIQPNIEDGTVDITYQLETKSSDQIEFSLGWGATGVVGSIGVTFSNFAIQNLFKPETYRIVPQGEGQTFSVTARTNAQYYSSASISFLEPWLGGKRPNALSATIFFASQSGMSDRYYSNLLSYYQNYYNYYYYGYGSSYYNSSLYASEADPDTYMRTLGVSVGYGKRLSWPDDYFQLYGGLSYQMYMLSNWPSYYLRVTDGVCHDLALNLVLTRNSIDNPIYTRRGSTFTLGLKLTPPYSLINGKDYSVMDDEERYKFIEYHKWTFSAKTFTPLTRDDKLVLMARAEFGYIGHYNEYAKTPFGLYYMGGDGMSSYSTYATEYIAFRGYEAGSLTPYDLETGYQAGYLYNKFTIEMRYPIALEQNATIWALAFVDAGNCFSSLKDYNPFELKRSAGVGVRIYLPMFGLMGIDWAYGFDAISGSMDYSGSQFHFVLGQEL